MSVADAGKLTLLIAKFSHIVAHTQLNAWSRVIL